MIDFTKIKTVAIFTHIRPDGDALGSMLGLMLALRKKGLIADCFCDSPIPSALEIIPGADTINNPEAAQYDMLIAVDCADEFRLGKYKDIFLKHKNTVNIDHHMTNNSYAKHNIIKPYASTCEMIYDIVKEQGIELDRDIAMSLYVGIMTDTGQFSQSNTTPHSHIAAADLVSYGIDIEYISQKVFKETSKQKLMLINDCISSMRFYEDDKIAIITIKEEDLQRHDLDTNDTEGIINYAINVSGVMIGACLTQSSDKAYKVSLRSKKGINVADIAKDFGGGGHIQAAGLMLNGYLEDVIERLVRRCVIELRK